MNHINFAADRSYCQLNMAFSKLAVQYIKYFITITYSQFKKGCPLQTLNSKP